MNGQLAQLITLVSYGNAFLNGNPLPANFYPDHSAFRYCDSIRILMTETDSLSSYDPTGWLKHLKQTGCKKLRLLTHPIQRHDISAREAAAFAGAGNQWSIQTVGQSREKNWLALWSLDDQNKTDQRIWQVEYQEYPLMDSYTESSLAEAHHHLFTILTKISGFAAKQNLPTWQHTFETALTQLTASENPSLDPLISLLHPTTHPKEAYSLISAARCAWVFGGMGSWNDLGFEDKDAQITYETYSDELYQTVLTSYQAATNAE